MQDKCFVLFHGAGLGSWIWDKVIPFLKLPSAAVDLPGRGKHPDSRGLSLEGIVDIVINDLERETSGKMILVGHSLSGVVALRIAARIPEKIAAIVMVNGAVPVSGRSYMSLLPPVRRIALAGSLILNPGGMTAPRDGVIHAYCNDLDEEKKQMVLDRIVRESPAIFTGCVDWKTIPETMPRYFIELFNDNSDPECLGQDLMASTLKSNSVKSLNTGHLPMLSRPAELAGILNELAG